MSKKSADSKVTRKSAAEIPRASKADLDRLHAAMQGDIDTSEIPERRKFQRLKRETNGELPRKSMLREAVAREMQHLNLTVYRLWRLARVHYPPLSQSAVHEFLKGQRQLELPSVEALLTAVNLCVVPKGGTRRKQSPKPAKN